MFYVSTAPLGTLKIADKYLFSKTLFLAQETIIIAYIYNKICMKWPKLIFKIWFGPYFPL